MSEVLDDYTRRVTSFVRYQRHTDLTLDCGHTERQSSVKSVPKWLKCAQCKRLANG